jgi:hypothetical protein
VSKGRYEQQAGISEETRRYLDLYDREDYRRSLYTNTKPDHPANPRTEGPCNCERGDTAWERSGIAMRVDWPRARPRRGRSR